MHKVFGAMEVLIQHNICDQYIIQQQKIYHFMNVILRKKQTHVQLVEYLHKAFFSPTKTTFTKAIGSNNVHTQPGLTEEPVNKHLPKSISTARGHMASERKGLHSTTRPPVTNQQKLKDITNNFLQLKKKSNQKQKQKLWT